MVASVSTVPQLVTIFGDMKFLTTQYTWPQSLKLKTTSETTGQCSKTKLNTAQENDIKLQ